MDRKSTGNLHSLPFDKDADGFNPRIGQEQVRDWVAHYPESALLTVRFPGGYGKTLAVLLAYLIRRAQGICNRLLFVVANDTQVHQLQRDLLEDCATIGLDISGIWKFTNDGTTIRANLEDRAEIFIINIQSVSSTNRKEVDTLLQLLRGGNGRMNWMLAADEYHHYAIERDWGLALGRLIEFCTFTMATSATPDRDGNPTIFGDPIIIVTYEDAVRERALKMLRLHTYHYDVDVHMRDGSVCRYTTDELRDKQIDGSLNQFEEKTVLRYSAKYYHPLVTHPVSRLVSTRDLTGRRLQMLIKAMSCLHAAMLCEQIKELAPTLLVDWVGTGPHGRPPLENQRIIEAFCPRKYRGARSDPQLDILVQVAMAGEGLDCIPVTEEIDLSLSRAEGASTQLRQFFLRGSRWIPNLSERFQICHINLPSDHPLSSLMNPDKQDAILPEEAEFNFGEDLAPYIDEGITHWIDGNESTPGYNPRADSNDNDSPAIIPPPTRDDYETLFIRPRKRSIELTQVRDDDPHFKDFLKRAKHGFATFSVDSFDIADPMHLELAKQWYTGAREAITGSQDEQTRIAFVRDKVRRLADNVVQLALLTKAADKPIERSERQAMYKRMNTAIAQIVGGWRSDLFTEELAQAWEVLAQWDHDIRSGRPPTWAR
jgi:superfamily II DNA or RNA helicase